MDLNLRFASSANLPTSLMYEQMISPESPYNRNLNDVLHKNDNYDFNQQKQVTCIVVSVGTSF